ncbi:hypothetical protein BDF14DRAFT_1865610 [Spinellus fusiger]|nr:hypothetical protein BDF14DRAFT_1865610 [Spinellus fusiger]
MSSFITQNLLYLALPSPVPDKDSKPKFFFHSFCQSLFDQFIHTTSQVLIQRCHPLLEVDPVLFLPATRAERSCLVCWRLGWLPGVPVECSCGHDHTSHCHLCECPCIPESLWDDLPVCPAGVHPIDACLNLLPRLSPTQTISFQKLLPLVLSGLPLVSSLLFLIEDWCCVS